MNDIEVVLFSVLMTAMGFIWLTSRGSKLLSIIHAAVFVFCVSLFLLIWFADKGHRWLGVFVATLYLMLVCLLVVGLTKFRGKSS